MCGIIGMAGPGIQQVDLKVFTDIMRISTLRGIDGTGIFQGRFHSYGKNTFLIEKKCWEVNSFFRYHKSSAGNKLLLNSVADNIFIGHTRWATMGARDDASCHPFHVNNIVGVHNGTMEDIKYYHKDKTDSELLYEDIQRRGVKSVLEDADADSAYALSFFDMEKRVLTFARNDQRTLYGAFHLKRKVMYWASESGFIECAADRHNLEISKPFYFQTNKICSINVADISHNKDCGFKIEDFTPRAKVTKKKDTHSTTTFTDNYNGIDWTGSTAFDDGPIPFDNGTYDPPVNGEKPIRLTKAQRKEKKRVEALQRQQAAAIIKKNSNITLAPSPMRQLEPQERTLNLVVNNDKPIIRLTQCPKIPTYSCMGCQRELKLIDQYLAQKDTDRSGTKIFECSECTRLGKKLINNLSVTVN